MSLINTMRGIKALGITPVITRIILIALIRPIVSVPLILHIVLTFIFYL